MTERTATSESSPVLSYTEEQDALREAVRAFLQAKSPIPEVRRLMETSEGYDPDVWAQMAGELALQGLALPEEYGGQGFTFRELGIVLEEMGRVLLCAPYFSTVVLAANAILNAGDEAQRRELLPGLAEGTTIATLAVTEANGRWDASGIELTARAEGDGLVLDGSKTNVIDGHIADLVVVAARLAGTTGEDGVVLAVVQGDATGLTRSELATMDATRKQARLDFAGVPATALGTPGNGWDPLSKTMQQATALLTSEMAGGFESVLEMSVEYAKARSQFGRPIGSFQAIKHKCADMLVECESSTSAARYAAWAVASGDDGELATASSLAKAYCSDAYSHAVAENIQIHGGIGFTWEHDAHLYFKRAKTSELLFGDATLHRELLAQRIGL